MVTCFVRSWKWHMCCHLTWIVFYPSSPSDSAWMNGPMILSSTSYAGSVFRSNRQFRPNCMPSNRMNNKCDVGALTYPVRTRFYPFFSLLLQTLTSLSLSLSLFCLCLRVFRLLFIPSSASFLPASSRSSLAPFPDEFSAPNSNCIESDSVTSLLQLGR